MAIAKFFFSETRTASSVSGLQAEGKEWGSKTVKRQPQAGPPGTGSANLGPPAHLQVPRVAEPQCPYLEQR